MKRFILASIRSIWLYPYYSKPADDRAGHVVGDVSLFGDNDFGVRFFSPVIFGPRPLGLVCLRDFAPGS